MRYRIDDRTKTSHFLAWTVSACSYFRCSFLCRNATHGWFETRGGVKRRVGGRYGRDRGGRSPTGGEATVIPPSPNCALKGDSFDYLTEEVKVSIQDKVVALSRGEKEGENRALQSDWVKGVRVTPCTIWKWMFRLLQLGPTAISNFVVVTLLVIGNLHAQGQLAAGRADEGGMGFGLDLGSGRDSLVSTHERIPSHT